MKATAFAVLVCAFLTFIGDVCVAQDSSTFEIAITATRRTTKRIEAVDFEGWTDYPDESELYVGLSYMGNAVKWVRVIVAKGRFKGSIEFVEPEALPLAVYEIEVDYMPDRQATDTFRRLPFKRYAQPYMVGTAKEITEYRKKRLEEWKKMADLARNLYDPLRKIYVGYEAQSGFNPRKWDTDVAEWIAQAALAEEQIAKQRFAHVIMLFPMVEEGVLSFARFIASIPQSFRAYLIQTKGGKPSGHMGGGPVIDAMDDAVRQEYETILGRISLKEKMGDEDLVRAWLVRFNNLFTLANGTLEDCRNRGAKSDDKEWVRASTAMGAEMPGLSDGLVQFEKSDYFREFPVRLDGMKELVLLLEDFKKVCEGCLDGGGDREAYELAYGKCRSSFASTVSQLGLTNSLVTTAPPVTQVEVKLTPELEAKIKQDVAAFASGTDEACTATAIRLFRLQSIAVPFLLQGLEGNNRKIALWCARALAMHNDERVVPALVKYQDKNRDRETQLIIIDSVGVIGHTCPDVSVPFLLKQIETKDDDVRLACLKAMSSVKSVKFIFPGCDCLTDKNVEIRNLAISMLDFLTGGALTEQGYNPAASESERKQFAQDLKAHWREQLGEGK